MAPSVPVSPADSVPDIAVYQAAVDSLRVRGCRCALIARNGLPMPLYYLDGVKCPVAHYAQEP